MRFPQRSPTRFSWIPRVRRPPARGGLGVGANEERERTSLEHLVLLAGVRQNTVRSELLSESTRQLQDYRADARASADHLTLARPTTSLANPDVQMESRRAASHLRASALPVGDVLPVDRGHDGVGHIGCVSVAPRPLRHLFLARARSEHAGDRQFFERKLHGQFRDSPHPRHRAVRGRSNGCSRERAVDLDGEGRLQWSTTGCRLPAIPCSDSSC